jgi:NADPH:quinone reductase-like Zn-dependent oxidoreductase
MGLIRPTRVNILGQEFAGKIESLGKDVNRFSQGDQVFAPAAFFKAYAEYICLPGTSAMATKPTNMTYEEAAAVPTGGLNALHYLRLANIRSGEKVLIVGACGNMGTFAVQLAKHYGAEVTGVDSTDKLDMLRSIGADHVIDYTREDFTENGKTYDVIFNVLGMSSIARDLRSLTQKGRYLLVNPRLLPIVQGLWTSMISNKKVLFKFASYKTEDLNFLKKLIEAGKIKSIIDRRYPLEQIAEAHAYVDTGRHKGNVVITIESND